MVSIPVPEILHPTIPRCFEQPTSKRLRGRRVRCERLNRNAATELPGATRLGHGWILGARQEVPVREVPVVVRRCRYVACSAVSTWEKRLRTTRRGGRGAKSNLCHMRIGMELLHGGFMCMVWGQLLD